MTVKRHIFENDMWALRNSELILTLSTDYIQTLKKIKETEEAANKEMLERRRGLEEDLRRTEEAAAASVTETMKQAEAFVSIEVENAHKSAQKEAEALLASVTKKADEIAVRRLDKSVLGKIIDEVILAELK